MTTYYRCAKCQAILVGEQTQCPRHPAADKSVIGEQAALEMALDPAEYERELEAERIEDEGRLRDMDEQSIDRSWGG